MNKKKPVVCLGIMVADVVGRPVESFPDKGRLVVVDEMSLHTGGCAVNDAIGLVKKSSILHFAGTFVLPGIDGEPSVALLRKARAAGVTIFLDTAWDALNRWMELLAAYLPLIDYFVPSLGEAQQLTGLEQPQDVARARCYKNRGLRRHSLHDRNARIYGRRKLIFSSRWYNYEALFMNTLPSCPFLCFPANRKLLNPFQ